MQKKIYQLNGLLLAVCLLVSCKQTNTNKKMPAPAVNIVEAAQQTVPIYSEFVGQVYGDTDVQVQPRIQGWITGTYFQAGEYVQKGSLLYTLDDLSSRAEVEGYQANVAQAQTNLANTKSYLDRVRPLAQMNALSQVDLESAETNYKAAQDVVKASNAQLSSAQIKLSYTKIKAPISGFIGISKSQVGDLVGGLGSGALNTISATSNVKVRFPISENEFLWYVKKANADPAFQKQMKAIPVSLLLNDGSVYAETGKLNLVDRGVDPSTGSILVQAIFPNPQQVLKPGQYAKVRFKTNEFQNAVVVPQQAVNQMQNIYQVFVLNDSNKVVPRVVTTSKRIGSGWIVTSGLKAGEKVAIIGNAFINYNNPVKPVLVNWNANADTSL